MSEVQLLIKPEPPIKYSMSQSAIRNQTSLAHQQTANHKNELNCVTDDRAERHLQKARSNLIGYADDWSADTEEKLKSQQRNNETATSGKFMNANVTKYVECTDSPGNVI
ncbi:hypothetical protein T01_2323 [Trichinella spiralis]|uniref:Uncharacterized protein n=1 Tax=Trichinella spiralis TaxID=6334 RepID=A0A0V1ANE8_TRISP|nr:hypothetical protein T01_2323 [Trichinella spiralis]